MKRKHVSLRACSSRGFTLIEAMIATLVFAIGMMAVITMEFSAIRAYRVAQDQTIATDLAERTISVVEIESANWSGEKFADVMSVYNNTSPFHDGGAGEPIIRRVRNNPWEWQVLTEEPVNTQLANTKISRFCIYARGGESDLVPNSSAPLIQMQVAVVYPSSSAGFARNGDCSQVMCNGSDEIVTDLLRPEGWESNIEPPLEACGWRAVYKAALVSR